MTLSEAIRQCSKIFDNLSDRTPKTLSNIVNIFSTKSSKIAGENVNIDKESKEAPEGNQDWRKLVGSIRRKVQRHASGASDNQSSSGTQAKNPSVSRKNSLTHSILKREKSCDKDGKSSEKQPLMKQKSNGLETSTSITKTDLFKALSFRDKSKSVSVKNVDTISAHSHKPGDTFVKGVRKSDKKDSDRNIKSNISFSKAKSSCAKGKEGLKQDDFLKATMRIFLVVSPPAGKMQVIFSNFLLHCTLLLIMFSTIASVFLELAF